MATITTINAGDQISASRSVINTNFDNLNDDKVEKADNLSDLADANDALNNILPDQSGQSGKVLQSDGVDTSWQSPSGSPKATQSVIGITALSVAAADPSLPNAVGDNDPRVPTQSENDALVGTGTPSSTNKYVTKDTNDLNELLANKSTSTTLGTSNTLYPSQNAVKTYVDGKALKLVGVSSVDLGSSSIADTNENTYLTVAVPGGTLGTGNAIRFKGHGTWSNGTGGTNLTIRMKYGGTTVWSYVVPAGSAINGNFVWDFILYATGATNSQTGRAHLQYIRSTFVITDDTLGTTATAAIDSTASQNLTITTQLASTSNPSTIDLKFYTIDVIS